MNHVITILVVEDDQLVQATVEDSLEEGGFETASTASGEEAIALLQDKKFQYRAICSEDSMAGLSPRCQRDGSLNTSHLYDRHAWGGLGF